MDKAVMTAHPLLTFPPDLSVERVATLAQEDALPEPFLDLGSLPPPTSNFHDIMQEAAWTSLPSWLRPPRTRDDANASVRPDRPPLESRRGV